jgi:hypothetical protein
VNVCEQGLVGAQDVFSEANIMAERPHRNLPGMKIEFVSGRLEERPSEGAIGYSAVFDLSLDFLNFKVMADLYVPDYLDSPINAIRPELDGLGHHYAYNYFSDSAGKITSNEALFRVFTPSDYYMSEWSVGGLENRYAKPVFELVGGQLRATVRRDFRWGGDKRQVQIRDLPIIDFRWALNLLESEEGEDGGRQPGSKVILMDAEEEVVKVESRQMFRGTLYMVGRELEFGEIPAERLLRAGQV